MGSTDEPLNKLRRALQLNPGGIHWDKPREVIVCRGTNGKLGVHLKTITQQGAGSLTVVVKVKEDCHVVSGYLQPLDLISHIQGSCITGFTDEQVQHLLNVTKNSETRLKLVVLGFKGIPDLPMNLKETGTNFKRILSQTSSGSGGSKSQGTPDILDVAKAKKLATIKNGPHVKNPLCMNRDFLHPADLEPLLNQVPEDRPARKTGKIDQEKIGGLTKKYVQKEVGASKDLRSGLLMASDQIKENPSGIMSVTDIEVTMREDTHVQATSRGGNAQESHNAFCPQRSPTEKSVQPSFASSSPSRSLSIEHCSKATCANTKCLWHRSVLKFPHLVRWEPNSVTIELHRQSTEQSFGFNHKIKQHVQTSEIFYLVSEVEKNSPAGKSGLAVGDLIHSVNNIPLEPRQKLQDIMKKVNNLRLQIQHPKEMSVKAGRAVDQLAISIREEVPPLTNTILKPPQSPSTSPPDASFVPPFSPNKETIPLLTIQKPMPIRPGGEQKQLPQVRVFVFGSGTNEFVRCLLSGFINVPLDSRATCYQISMKKSQDGEVTIKNSESFSYLFRESSESCINVELISVFDDSFFNHCCPWMFTQRAVFILTVDYKRLIQSTNLERSRLCSLAHTVRTGAPGALNNLKLYAITSLEDSAEVSALFYTSLGDSLPRPLVVSVSSSPSPGPSLDLRGVRAELFDTLSPICRQQLVSPLTSQALDMLMSHRSLITSRQEVTGTLQGWDPQHAPDPVTLVQVIEDLRVTGNLIVTGALNAGCVSEGSKEFVVSWVLLEYLSRLAQIPGRNPSTTNSRQDTWLMLSTRGIVSRAEMQDMLSSLFGEADKLLVCMEELNLLYPVHLFQLDSGFDDSAYIMFPYFLEDVSFNAEERDFEKYTTIEFGEDVPSSCFYHLLSEMSQGQDFHSLSLDGQYVAMISMRTEQLCLCFIKTGRRIEVYSKRPIRPSGKLNIGQHLHQMVSSQLPTMNVKLVNPSSKTGAHSQAVGGDEHRFLTVGARSQQQLPSIHPVRLPDNSCTVCAVTEMEPQQPRSSVPLPGVPEMDPLQHPHQTARLVNQPAQNVPELTPQEQEEAQIRRVLQMQVREMKHIYEALFEIYKHISIYSKWKELAGCFGLTTTQLGLYESMQSKRPDELPGQTFLESYIQSSGCTLEELMKTLMKLAEKNEDDPLKQLTQILWSDAFFHHKNR